VLQRTTGCTRAPSHSACTDFYNSRDETASWVVTCRADQNAIVRGEATGQWGNTLGVWSVHRVAA
jgi:hypothetical protein